LQIRRRGNIPLKGEERMPNDGAGMPAGAPGSRKSAAPGRGKPAAPGRTLRAAAPAHADALDGFSAAIAGVGTQHFEAALLAALQPLVAVDHLTILTLRPAEGLRMLGVASRVDLSAARSLTRDYVAREHVLDPNYAVLAGGAGSRRVLVRRHDAARLKTDPYRTRFYTSVGIVDKVAYIWRAADIGYYVNFYRTTRCGRYAEEDVATLAALARFVSALVHLHGGRRFVQATLGQAGGDLAERLALLLGAGMTTREGAVVARILKGMRTEGIAIDLGLRPSSVITFRKRAYAKLGIASQAELFACCLRVLPDLGS
jgi:DNA-binding CsgD family transcriptional regulator